MFYFCQAVLYANLSRVPTLLPSQRSEDQTKQAYKMLSDCFRFVLNTFSANFLSLLLTSILYLLWFLTDMEWILHVVEPKHLWSTLGRIFVIKVVSCMYVFFSFEDLFYMAVVIEAIISNMNLLECKSHICLVFCQRPCY